MNLQIYESYNGSITADWSGRYSQAKFSTTENGFGIFSCFVAMSYIEALFWYQRTRVYHVSLNYGAGVAFEGRLEDVRIVEGGINITAYGYWRAFSDVPYTALWSTKSVAEFEPATVDYLSSQTPERYEMDNNNRVYIAPRKGEGFTTLNNQGAQVYRIPDSSERQIVAVEYDYEFFANADWRAQLNAENEGGASAASLWTLTGNSTLQSGTNSHTFAGKDNLRFIIVPLSDITSHNSNTAAYRLKITNLRIKATTSSNVYADEIVSGLVSFVNGVNDTQTGSSTALIESPLLDLNDEIYEDELPSKIIKRLAGLGDSNNNRYEAAVWEGQVLRFNQRGANGREWYVNIESLSASRSLDKLYNSAYVKYKNENGRTIRTVIDSDPNSVAEFGVTRRGYTEAQTTSLSEAQDYRALFIEDNKQIKPEQSLQIKQVFNAGGAAYPLWMVRSGDKLTIRNIPDFYTGNIDKIRTFVINQTDYDLDNDTLRITPELPPSTLEFLVGRLRAGVR